MMMELSESMARYQGVTWAFLEREEDEHEEVVED